MDDPLDTLRDALLAMKPAGHDGFEGLCAIGLSQISGLRFRLASSGYQRGLDGAADGADLVFEATRYEDRPPHADVLSKIPDFARGTQTHADRLWALCATSEVPAQLSADLKDDADKQAISTLILDWPSGPLPPLASVLAAGGPDMAQAIHERAPDAGRANAEWRARTFASRDAAKGAFGQPSCPSDMRWNAPISSRRCMMALGPVACPYAGSSVRSSIARQLSSGLDIAAAKASVGPAASNSSEECGGSALRNGR